MTFVTELISAADQQSIGFDQLNDIIGRPMSPYLWTVDRDRSMFLLHTYQGGEDFWHMHWFIFDVSGTGRPLQLSCMPVPEDGGAVYPWALLTPPESLAGLMPSFEETMAALKEALVSWTNRLGPVHKITFDF